MLMTLHNFSTHCNTE